MGAAFQEAECQRRSGDIKENTGSELIKILSHLGSVAVDPSFSYLNAWDTCLDGVDEDVEHRAEGSYPKGEQNHNEEPQD